MAIKKQKKQCSIGDKYTKSEKLTDGSIQLQTVSVVDFLKEMSLNTLSYFDTTGNCSAHTKAVSFNCKILFHIYLILQINT